MGEGVSDFPSQISFFFKLVASYKKYHCDVAVKYKVLMPDISCFSSFRGEGVHREMKLFHL
jgi:hypothetical protein